MPRGVPGVAEGLPTREARRWRRRRSARCFTRARAADHPSGGDARSHLVTMAFHESLDVAERDALLDMVRWLHAIVQSTAGSVTETQLYRAASLVADMRVTQVVNVKTWFC